MNPDMKKLAKDNEYLFIQDGTRDHTAKLILEMLKDKKKKKMITRTASVATK